VVKQKLALMLFDNDKTDQITCHFYATCAVSVEPTNESFARTVRIKSSKPHKALSHSLDPDGYQV
jgi:hypothetical protein